MFVDDMIEVTKCDMDATLGLCLLNILEYIVGSRGASQLVGSLLGIQLGYKANKL